MEVLRAAGFREKLQGAGELDVAVAMAKKAGFAVSKEDWLRYQALQIQQLSDAGLESAGISGLSCLCVGRQMSLSNYFCKA